MMEGDPNRIESTLENTSWKFSKIDGDPKLGRGVKCYATKQYNMKISQEFIVSAMNTISTAIQGATGCVILRKKIELVVFDERNLSPPYKVAF